jgi:hypothetical protein
LKNADGALAKLVRKISWAVQLNEHVAERGDIRFPPCLKLGYEGIVSKRLGSPYLSGRSRRLQPAPYRRLPRPRQEDRQRQAICAV